MTPDLVIRGGTVLDGSGRDGFAADIAVADGRIAAIGRVPDTPAPELDATGLTVAPGFIDIHSHSDWTLLVDPRAVSAVHQGVTTEVLGNCGYGCFPVRQRELSQRVVYGYSEDIAFDWTSAAGYFERLEQARPAVNVLSLTPNGQLRLATTGFSADPATPEQVAEMTRLLEQALEEGAWGYSTGLEYSSEAGASEDEVTALATVTARHGGLYATHTQARDDGAADAVAEAIRTGRRAGGRTQISHLMPRNGAAESAHCLDLVERARADGLDIAFDMHTRLYGLTYLHVALPPWALAGERDAQAARLRDREARERMKQHRSIISGDGDWSRVELLDNPVWPEYARRNIASIAAERGQEPFDCVFDLLLGGLDRLHEMMAIIRCYTEDQQADAFAHPLCIPGSDATDLAPDGPLAGASFHGAYTWAAWFWRFMVRERRALTAPQAIAKLTSQPAATLGLSDRGVLKEGARADIAIFDPATFGERGTTYEPNQLATGMVHVLVNGVPTLQDGALTGERAGAALRRPVGGVGF